MALSDDNELKVCKILGVLPTQLDYQLTWLGATFTSVKQTAVEAEIERWDAGAGVKFTRVEARDRNFGSVIDPEKEKSDIRRNIAILLERPEWANVSGGITSRVQRG